jgi:DNA-dependent RNA polymerase auxiliary subunit epsilon
MGLVDPCAELEDLQARNFIIACYAVSLVQGETIRATPIRHATLKGYIAQALECHAQRKLVSPLTAEVDFIKIISNAVRKYEKVPNRREMIHDSMYHHMISLKNKFCKSHPDCLVVALCDWMFLGRYVGFRKSEWCNDHKTSYAKIDDPEWGTRPNPLSLIKEDIQFFSSSGAPVTLTEATLLTRDLPEAIAYVELLIRKQKNNDNYQTLKYSRCSKNSDLCPVHAAFRIVCRATHLNLPAEHPVAIYRDSKTKERRQITGEECNMFLRQVASTVFKIPPNSPALKKWSTHSVRVTAANLLHRARFSDSYIKNRLRWRSDTFLMYLRNTFYTANDHTKALDIGISPQQPSDFRPAEDHESIIAEFAAA